MKKIIILLSILAIMLTGCNASAYEAYSKAINLTEEAKTGKSRINTTIELEFEKDGLSEEQISNLKSWEKIQVDALTTFDKTKEQSLTEVYASFANLGLEGKIYEDKDKLYIVTALLPKILMIKSDDVENIGAFEEFEEQFSSDFINQFQEKWEAMLNQENVSTLGNIIISTPEGEIKAREYEVTLTKEQVMPMIIDGIELFNKSIIEAQKEDEEVDYDEIRKLIEESMEDVEFEKIYHRAYIDRDGFVVEEETHIILNIPTIKSGNLKKIDLHIKSQSWDLDKTVDIQLPELGENNIITLQDLQNDSNIMNQFKGVK